MKKKFLNVLLTLILIIPCSIVFAACEKEEPYHEHNAWENCLECNEIVHLGQHKLEYTGYDSLIEKDVYKCTTCDFVLHQIHKHNFNSYKITPTYHWDVCGTCGYEASSNGFHQYGTIEDGWTSNCKIENGTAKCKCVVCGHEKTVDLVNFENDTNGSVEVLSDSDNNYIIKPVANDGYYFEKWLIHKDEYNGKSLTLDELGANDTESIKPIINVEPRIFNDSLWAYTLKPVFTTTEPTFDEIEVELNVENNIPVEIEYMLYKNEYGTQISYYLPQNNNVVLKRIITNHTGDSNSTKTHYNSTNYDGSLTLPLSSTCGADYSIGNCEKVKFEFKDVRNKYAAKVKYEVNGEIYDLLADAVIGKTETFYSDENGNITIEKGAIKYQDKISNISYFYVDRWVDELGNIVSYNKKFTTQINVDRTFTAIMKQADEIYESNGVVYLFSKNEDETLTFEALYTTETAGNVVLPNLVNETNVTGIGENAFIPTTLNMYGYFISSILVPNSIVNFDNTSFHDVGLCDIEIEGYKANLTFDMFKNTKFAIYSSVYSSAASNSISITNDTLNNMIQKFVQSFVDCILSVELVDSEHLGNNILGHYEKGSQKLCLLQTKSYSFATFAVITYELRHFYQEIAIGNVSGLTVDSLKISPAENQVGAWKYLDYADKTQDPDGYWFNAREIDAREFTENLMGCNIFER